MKGHNPSSEEVGHYTSNSMYHVIFEVINCILEPAFPALLGDQAGNSFYSSP